MPAHRFRIGLAGRALGGGYFGQFKPWVIGEQAYDALPDQARCAEHACAKLFIGLLRLRAHADSLLAGAQHCCAPTGAIRVPRTCGLNVLRTQTVISVSWASGRTRGCRTFAPLKAKA